MTDVARVRLPAAHELALLASRVAVEFDLAAKRWWKDWEYVPQLRQVLADLATSTHNFGPWLSDAGEAVHSALVWICLRELSTTEQLNAELQQIRVAFDLIQRTSPAPELERLRDFSIALSRAAQREASRR